MPSKPKPPTLGAVRRLAREVYPNSLVGCGPSKILRRRFRYNAWLVDDGLVVSDAYAATKSTALRMLHAALTAAHGYELGTDRRPCVVPSCLCVTLEKEEVKFRERTKNEVGDLG